MKYFIIVGLIICAGFGVVVSRTDTANSASTALLIQDQGSSPYCLFAVTAYLINGDMWQLSADYYRRNLPTVDGRIPLARPVIDLAGETHPMIIGKHWDSATVQKQVQHQPVAATGQGHAIVLLSWRNGKITYVDSLHAEKVQTMTDQAFWAWSDGWYWWVQ